MNYCQFRNDFIKRMCNAGGGGGLQAAWQDIVDTCAYNAGKTTTYTLTYIDNPVGTADAVGVAINAPGGKLYMLPYNGTSTIELDTATDSTTVITGTQSQLSSAPKIFGACYVDNAFYCMSYENKAIYKFDLSNKTYSQLATVSNQYMCLCYDGSTYIYSLSFDTSGKILRYNVKTNAVEEISGLTNEFNKYQRLQLHPNGKLYASPQYYDKIIELEPNDIQNPVYFTGYRVHRSCFCCLTADGNIATAPWETNQNGTQNATTANVETKVVTYAPGSLYSSTGFALTSNIVLTPTGAPLILPQSYNGIFVYDTSNNNVTKIGQTQYSNNGNAYYYRSGILAANNSAYCCPGRTANVKILKISINIAGGRNFKETTILSPFMNKY